MKSTAPRTSRRLVAGLAVGALTLAACGSDSNDAEEPIVTEEAAPVGTIVDVAVANGSFDTLVAAVTAADLVETLSSDGPFTVFAPTDEAFAALPEGLLDALLLPENSDALTAILTYHVIGAEVPSSDVTAGDVETVQGEAITIAADGDALTINGTANITAVDVEASNGVIHVIDQVLVPPSIDPTVLLADDAMEEEPTEEEAAAEGTIVDVAVANGSFDTLVAAVTAADLVETLSSDGPFTVFAPTDEAFAALPEGLLDALLLPENSDALTAILTYHVIGAEVPSSDVTAGDVETVQGEAITIAADGDALTINGTANITAVDVEASNGVIHVIDQVLVPPSIDPTALLADDAMEEEPTEEEAAAEGTIVEVATEAGNFETLIAAASAAGIDGVLDGPGAFTIFAPTDEAFAALPDGLVDALLLPENSAALTAILTYHGLAAEVPSSDVAAGDVTTIQGEDITITVDGDTVMVNDATITAFDVEASNGVIHVIDSVLVPPSIDVTTLL